MDLSHQGQLSHYTFVIEDTPPFLPELEDMTEYNSLSLVDYGISARFDQLKKYNDLINLQTLIKS